MLTWEDLAILQRNAARGIPSAVIPWKTEVAHLRREVSNTQSFARARRWGRMSVEAAVYYAFRYSGFYT
jgi:hypothetical protein